MKIWQRYILGQAAKTFLFFLFCFFFLYVFVDLAVHGVRFFRAESKTIVFYYMQTFAVHLDLFLNMAFLLAALKVLFDLNAHRELIALQMAFLSKKRLLLPFFFLAGLLAVVSYINSQWLIKAQDMTDAFRKGHKKTKKMHLYAISLEDDSELVYQAQDKGELFDVFWIRAPNDIWHMKTLKLEPVSGTFVDHFVRNQAKQLESTERFAARDFPELRLNKKTFQQLIPFRNRPLSLLFSQALIASSERPTILTHLSYKLTVPLIPFLILFSVAPFCLRFSKRGQFFLVAACSLFGLIAIKVIFDGMLVLGENQVLPSLVVILGPFSFLLACSLYSFGKMQ